MNKLHVKKSVNMHVYICTSICCRSKYISQVNIYIMYVNINKLHLRIENLYHRAACRHNINKVHLACCRSCVSDTIYISSTLSESFMLFNMKLDKKNNRIKININTNKFTISLGEDNIN